MSDEQQIEPTESEDDVEGHKLASKHAAGKHTFGEGDEGEDDVEAHKMASKISPKVEP